MYFFTLSLSKAGRKGLKKGIHSCTMEHFTSESPVVQTQDTAGPGCANAG